MNEFKNIAVVIDADNTQLSKLPDAMDEVSARGRIVAKRAYGNWKKEQLDSWEETIKNLAIKAVQQYDYVKGKNATDMALVIDTMDLLYKNLYDCFVIVSSDSDYTPLAIRLRESGVNVIGIGRENTPVSFKNSCDEFIYLENLSNKNERDKSSEKDEKGDICKVHELLKKAYDAYRDSDDFVNVGLAGSFIKRIDPGFDTVSYGFKKLSDFIAAFPDKYELKKVNGAEYKCFLSPCLAKEELLKLHKLIFDSFLRYKDETGYAKTGPAAAMLKNSIGENTYSNCGFKDFESFLKAFPEKYEVTKNNEAFKCIEGEETAVKKPHDEAVDFIKAEYELLKGSDGYAKSVDVKNALLKNEKFKSLGIDNVTDFIKNHLDAFEIKMHGPALLFKPLDDREKQILDKIHGIIENVFNDHKDTDGCVPMTIAGKYIKDFIPEEDLETAGYKKISQFIERFPKRYAVCPDNSARYKCI